MFCWKKFSSKKNTKFGAGSPPFWGDLGAKLRFWAPISPVSDIVCSFLQSLNLSKPWRRWGRGWRCEWGSWFQGRGAACLPPPPTFYPWIFFTVDLLALLEWKAVKSTTTKSNCEQLGQILTYLPFQLQGVSPLTPSTRGCALQGWKNHGLKKIEKIRFFFHLNRIF